MWTNQETWRNRSQWNSTLITYNLNQKGAVFSAFFVDNVDLNTFFCQKSIMHA